jgi:hypothetical protein
MGSPGGQAGGRPTMDPIAIQRSLQRLQQQMSRVGLSGSGGSGQIPTYGGIVPPIGSSGRSALPRGPPPRYPIQSIQDSVLVKGFQDPVTRKPNLQRMRDEGLHIPDVAPVCGPPGRVSGGIRKGVTAVQTVPKQHQSGSPGVQRIDRTQSKAFEGQAVCAERQSVCGPSAPPVSVCVGPAPGS